MMMRSALVLFLLTFAVLFIYPIAKGQPLAIGINYAFEPLGFAAFFFLLTVWFIRGRGEVRKARRNLFAAALYLISALDRLFFHLVL
jgi:hypothetical protein